MFVVKIILTSLSIVIGLALCCRADIRLMETPVQSQMDLLVAGDSWRDGETATASRDSETPGKQPAVTGKRSPFKAALLSAALPGAGQYYNGHRKKARYFFAAEALTWVGYVAFHTYGNWKKDDYYRFAAVHANAELEGKDEDFVDIVGFYDDIRQYNTLGRAYDPERPYLTDNAENHWQWASQDERREYRDLKNRSREAYRRADFMIGVAIIDRVISVIDAVRDALRANRVIASDFAERQQLAVKFAVNPLSSSRQFALTVYPGF